MDVYYLPEGIHSGGYLYYLSTIDPDATHLPGDPSVRTPREKKKVLEITLHTGTAHPKMTKKGQSRAYSDLKMVFFDPPLCKVGPREPQKRGVLPDPQKVVKRAKNVVFGGSSASMLQLYPPSRTPKVLGC